MKKTAKKTKKSSINPKTELKMLETVRGKETEILYKDLALLRSLVSRAYNHLGTMDSSENLAEASFKAGRAFEHLDKANDKLEDMLEDIYESNNFDHYDDVIEEY